MAYKGKFNKKKCATCVYRGTHGAAGLGVDVYCNYFDTGKVATKTVGRERIDLRGEDHNNCLLYEEGKQRRGSVQIVV